jgi:hypothetical protein
MDMEEIKSLAEQLLSNGGVEPATEEVEDAKKEEREVEEGDLAEAVSEVCALIAYIESICGLGT